jgi:acetolactate synthase I/II/III large subunit
VPGGPEQARTSRREAERCESHVVDADFESTVTQADAFASVLHDAGVREIFTLCGNHLLDAYRALVDRGITLIGVRSEGAAITAADGYARATKRLGVALVTGGPGHTNAITGLAGANSSGSPVLLLSGAPPAGRPGAGAHQELDQVSPVRSLCKWAAQVDERASLVPMLRAAIAAATRMPAGPAHLSVPASFLAGPAAEPSPAARGPVPPAPHAEGTVVSAGWVGERLAGASRPAAVVGAGAYFEDTEAAIAQFCRDHAIPVFTMDCARGAIPDDNELCFGYPDEPMNPAAAALRQSDLVLLFGHRVDFRFGFGAVFDPAAQIIEVSHDPRQLGVADERTFSVPGPTGVVLAELGARLKDTSRRFAGWLATVQASVPVAAAEYEISGHESTPFDPGTVARVIRDAISPEASVALDAGDFVQWCRALLTPGGSGQWLRAGRMSTCGSGLPLAVGAAVGRRAPVIAIVGDGSMGYHVAELETMARRGLPVLVIVGSNQAWGLELNLQNSLFDPSYGEVSRLGPVDYAAIAAGFGVESFQVSGLSMLAEQVRRFCRDPHPMLIDLPVTLEPSPLTQSIIAHGGV